MGKVLRTLAVCLLIGTIAAPAQAALVGWDFSWEKERRGTTYVGEGMFWYDTSGIDSEGKIDGGDIVRFMFEGFVNGVSKGISHALPSVLDFSPEVEFLGKTYPVMWSLKANSGEGASGSGAECGWFIATFCTLYEDGDKYRKSTGTLTITPKDDGGTVGLAEPGTLGLVGLGIFFAGMIRRRKNV